MRMFIKIASNMNNSQQHHSDAIQPESCNSTNRIEKKAIREIIFNLLDIKRGGKMTNISKKLGLRVAALTAATIGLSGCVYDMGLGYASDGYGYGSYDCDPYAPFDSYYACDNGYGFYNIGFGGGWYDSFWYPGYGYYVFDNYGRRHNMGDHHRRYWGDRRQRWYRDNRGHNNGHGQNDGRGDWNGRGDGRHDGRGHGNNATSGVDQPIGWPERNGGRRDERPGRRHDGNSGAVGNGDVGYPGGNRDDRRGDGRRGSNDGQGNGSAVLPPDSRPLGRPGPDRRAERGGRGGDAPRVREQSNSTPQGAGVPQPPARQRDAQPRPRPEGPRSRQAPDRVED